MQPQIPYGPPPEPYNPQPGAPGPAGPGQPNGYPPSSGQYGQQYQPHPSGYRPRPGQPAPLPAPPPAKQTPYDFFLSQKHAGAKGFGSVKQISMRLKILVVVGIALVVMVVIASFNALAPKDTTNQELFAVAQSQQEVIRVCNLGLTQAKYQVNRNMAINCVTGVTTDQARLLSYLKKAGYGFKAKNLGAKANPQVDQQLKGAQSSSNFDDTFKKIVLQELTSYNNLVQQKVLLPKLGPEGQTVLGNTNANNKLLLQQAGAETTDLTEAAQ